MDASMSIYETLEETVKPTHTALLVIDVQNDLCKNDDSQAMLPRLKHFIESCRRAGVFIVYLQNSTLLDGSSTSASEIARRKKWGMRPKVTVDGTWGHHIVDLVAPGETEPIVRKHRMSAFTNTTLDVLLRNRKIKTVLCAGVATHGCILSTAYSAMARDYYVVVVDDCVASVAANSTIYLCC